MGFRCPKCGGSEWGSHQLKDGTWQRRCHGDPGCTYSWHQSDDVAHDVGAEYLLRWEEGGGYLKGVELFWHQGAMHADVDLKASETDAARFPSREVATYIQGMCNGMTIVAVPALPIAGTAIENESDTP